MSLGPVMLDLEGVSLTADEKRLLSLPAVGGVILFTRNFESIGQLEQLCSEVHGIRNPHLLIAVDHEGGRVQRFRDGFTPLPPPAWYGEQYQKNPEQGLKLAQLGGWLMASELRASGVDFSFAPVLDIGFGISEVIGDRAFSRQPDIVARLAKAWMQGAHGAGMAVVGKHFPGHGGVKADSHLALPIDQRRFEDLEMEDLRPFETMIHAGMEAIMPAHVIYSHIDRELAGFSPFWLKKVLRQQLGFQGVIFSDDLNMAAAEEAGGYGDRAVAALSAGCDMVLICNNKPAAMVVLERLKDYADPAAHVRLVRMHGRKQKTIQQLHLDPQWKRAVNRLSVAPEVISLDLGLE
ncbi:MAG: beta-N-acetylhexosaminidase [gamma proteobacterium symbiont of Ctena orbiculata]|nr:beta-N-acetylhexosaminidase [Candidatus Thiodiazotropha taylori]PVV09719.1 MAG: beta-N-acetylhexosaminidase [gamma proteobacterium symbiont of Ctena orbiculata]MBT2997712.1 beta-N-acetylhexosaminidase [Candidatus Thiodiazotropha taylori]MBT3000519.1 beta-N-acetylhexosaminidase [Candidatus Thiodiazotropha taylori]MBT3027523.1 beta-N-acetylhexosaminidase [Candidatus Thiodiazotropha taylori]